MRGPAHLAYADNYLIDVKHVVIVDVEATRQSAKQSLSEDDDRANAGAIRSQACRPEFGCTNVSPGRPL
jgi:hypothetical protein